MEKKVVFNRKYYNTLMGEFGYNPLEFEKINFSLGKLDKDDLQRRWLCHHGGHRFANDLHKRKSIVTTGLGLTGVPHIGTLSQILRSIALQKAGIPVQMVLGDLDAYNHKAKPLQEALGLVEKFRKFILKLGFEPKFPSILRAQYDELQVLRTSYLIGHFIDHKMFNGTEEDLHGFYSKRGKIDKEMTYRRQLSLNLMTAEKRRMFIGSTENSLLIPWKV
jgi:hypothetical protein